MNKNVCIRIAFMVCAVLIGTLSLYAQKNVQELTRIILEKDSLFWIGYNNCDSSLTGQFFADDIEFYHDKGGITNGRQNLLDVAQKNLCSNPNFRLRREAIPGTVKVYPLEKDGTIYGAIMVGEHYFYITQNGKPEFRDGHASFTHLWLLKNGSWKIARILSYDHHAAAPMNQKKAITLPAASLKHYTGRFKGPQTDSLFIREEKGSLVLVNRNSKMQLYPETANLFFVKERDLTFEFLSNTKDIITGLRVRENGAVVEELKLVR